MHGKSLIETCAWRWFLSRSFCESEVHPCWNQILEHSDGAMSAWRPKAALLGCICSAWPSWDINEESKESLPSLHLLDAASLSQHSSQPRQVGMMRKCHRSRREHSVQNQHTYMFASFWTVYVLFLSSAASLQRFILHVDAEFAECQKVSHPLTMPVF